MSITLTPALYTDKDGNLRIPEETDIVSTGVLTTDQYYLLLVNMCYYKSKCDELGLKYDKVAICRSVLICKNILDIRIRSAMNSVGVNLIETTCQMYDIKEEENLRNHYDVVPGYMNKDGVPRVNLGSIKETDMDFTQ